MSAPRRAENPDRNVDNDGFTRPKFGKLPAAVTGLVVGGTADVVLGGKVVTFVYFISRSVFSF